MFFHRLLGCFMSPHALGFPDIPQAVHRSRERCGITEVLLRARLLNMERDRLAILERQVALLRRAM